MYNIDKIERWKINAQLALDKLIQIESTKLDKIVRRELRKGDKLRSGMGTILLCDANDISYDNNPNGSKLRSNATEFALELKQCAYTDYFDTACPVGNMEK